MTITADSEFNIETARQWLESNGFLPVSEEDSYWKFQREGRRLKDFRFEDTAVSIAIRKSRYSYELEAKYDQFVAFDTGDLKRFLKSLAESGCPNI